MGEMWSFWKQKRVDSDPEIEAELISMRAAGIIVVSGNLGS